MQYIFWPIMHALFEDLLYIHIIFEISDFGTIALQCQSVITFESEVRNLLSAFEPHSMDSLGHQHWAKKLSPNIALHFKVLYESKATLPIFKIL